VTSARIPLAELARLGSYFALRDGATGGEAGFEPVAGLLDGSEESEVRLRARIDDIAARLGTTQRWIGASIMFQGWAAHLTSIYTGSVVLAGAVPDLSAARLQYRRTPDGPVDLLAAPLTVTDPGSGWRLLAGGHIDPLANAIRRQVRIGRHLLLGNLGSALAGSLIVLAQAGHGRLDELTAAAWAQPAELRRYGQWLTARDGPHYARTTCCGYMQLPGGRRCGDCALSWRRAAATGPPQNQARGDAS